MENKVTGAELKRMEDTQYVINWWAGIFFAIGLLCLFVLKDEHHKAEFVTMYSGFILSTSFAILLTGFIDCLYFYGRLMVGTGVFSCMTLWAIALFYNHGYLTTGTAAEFGILTGSPVLAIGLVTLVAFFAHTACNQGLAKTLDKAGTILWKIADFSSFVIKQIIAKHKKRKAIR